MYGNEMPETAVDREIILNALSNLPEWLKHGLFLTRPGDAVVAGGFIRDLIAGVTPSDIDVFCQSREVMEDLAGIAREWHPNCWVTDTEDVIEIRQTHFYRPGDAYPVQLIQKSFPSAQDLVEHFDFLSCQFGLWYDYGKWSLYRAPGAWSAAKNRLLPLGAFGTEQALAALTHAFRLAAKGYGIDKHTLSRLLTQIVQKSPNDPMDCQEYLETALASSLYNAKRGTLHDQIRNTYDKQRKP